VTRVLVARSPHACVSNTTAGARYTPRTDNATVSVIERLVLLCLLIVGGNPLQNIAATQNVQYVIKKGRIERRPVTH
jgi:hypothetical protein